MRSGAAGVVLMVLLAGCVTVAAPRQVSLRRVDATVAAQSVTEPRPKPLRVAIASVISPQETLKSHGSLAAYLGSRLDRQVELVQRRTYQETYDLLLFGDADLAMVCTYVYVRGKAQFGLELLAAPAVDGKAEYQSLIITGAGGGMRAFSDLAGKRFAYTDPLSNTGRLYPLALIRELGRDPAGFFDFTTYTYSHDNAIKAVVQGVVDGAAVDSLVFDQWIRARPSLNDRLRVIGRSPAFASPPFVAAPGVAPELRHRVQEILLHMHEDSDGREFLRALGVDRFVTVRDQDYDSVRAVAAKAGVSP